MLKTYCIIGLLFLQTSCSTFMSGGDRAVDKKNLEDSRVAAEATETIKQAAEANVPQLDKIDNASLLIKDPKTASTVTSASGILRSNNDIILKKANKVANKTENIADRSDGYLDWNKIFFWIAVAGMAALIIKLGLLPIVFAAVRFVGRTIVKGVCDILEEVTVHEVTKKKNSE